MKDMKSMKAGKIYQEFPKKFFFMRSMPFMVRFSR